MYIRTSVSALFMSSLPHASYCPCTCTYLRLPSLHFAWPYLPLPALPAFACLRPPSPAFAWPCSAFSALPGLAYPPLRLSCIVRSCPALPAFARPCFASSGLACFAWLACFACPVFLRLPLFPLSSFCPFVLLLAFCALVLDVPVFSSKNAFLSLPA